MISQQVDRRSLMRGALALGVGAIAAGPTATALVLPSAPRPLLDERRIAFRNVHNGERIDARYFGRGAFDAQGLSEINHGLRDWRTGEVHPIDRGLIDLLADLRDTLDAPANKPFDLISGYRSPHTNAALGAQSQGVATRSQHMLGKATDVALPGIALDKLRAAARSLQKGGVGFYPQDGFVHIDTGRVRFW